MVLNVLLTIAAYLLGSIPSAVWIGKRFYGTDVREHGSGNAGATNTFRVLGRKAGLIVFAIDFVKGFVAVSLAYASSFTDGTPQMWNMKFVLTAAVVLGHIFPVFAGFRGGKGVATLAGAVMAVYPPAVLLCMVTFFIVLAISHYVSLSSMVAGVMLPIYEVFVFGQTYIPLTIFCCAVALLLVFTHWKNISRLLKGQENKTYLLKKNRKKISEEPRKYDKKPEHF
jgi:acyl-phosphate glycerol 3-phosphate acyltransferase